MGLDDLRGLGAPADIGTFQFPASIMVYHVTFSGTTYVVAVRQGNRGWILVSYLPETAANTVTVLQAALNGLTGGRTWIESIIVMGNYTYNATLTVNGFTYLEILGKWSLADNSNVNMIQMTNTEMVYIVNGELYGNRLNQGAASSIIYIDNTDHVWITKLRISYAYSHGIDFQNNPYSNFILGNGITFSGEHGLNGSLVDSTIVGNSIIANQGHGLNGSFSNGVICDNMFHHNTYKGINLSYCFAMTIVGNNCQQNGEDGICLDDDSDDHVVCDNVCRNNTRYGINITLASCERNIVFHNKLQGNGTAQFFDAGTGTMLPSLILPFVDGTLSVTANGAPKGWSITLATNFALALGVMPPDCQQSVRIKVHAISLAAEADGMRLQVTADACQPDEAWNAEDISITKTSTTLNFAANDGVIWTLTPADDADVDDLIAGDQIEIKAIYAAVSGADIATNALLRCVEIQYV